MNPRVSPAYYGDITTIHWGHHHNTLVRGIQTVCEFQMFVTHV